MELNINFDIVHRTENNPSSQAYLNLRRADFNNQCWKVLKRLLTGERITMRTGVNSEIGDIRRRSIDLIQFGIPVKREWARDENNKRLNYKEYFLTDEDRPKVALRIIDLAEQLAD
ncbi:MAG: hypothetical protein JWO06_219 [Bacteroidota bacterium]|nr:hypothetical protein [Bacteroidota bacterium]